MNSPSTERTSLPGGRDALISSAEKIDIRIKNEERGIDFPMLVKRHISIGDLPKSITVLLKIKYNITNTSKWVISWNDQILDEKKSLSDYNIEPQSVLHVDFICSSDNHATSPIETSNVRLDVKSELYQTIKGFVTNNQYKNLRDFFFSKMENISDVESIVSILSSMSRTCTINEYCVEIFDSIVRQKSNEEIVSETLKWFQGMTFNVPNLNLCYNIVDLCFSVFFTYTSSSTILQAVKLLENILTTNVPDELCVYVLNADINDNNSRLLNMLTTYISSVEICQELLLSVVHLAQSSASYAECLVTPSCFSNLFNMLSKYYQNRDIVRSIYTIIEKCLVYRMSLSVLMIPVEKCGHCLYKSKIFEQILFILQFNDEFILSRTLYLLSLMANYPYVNCFIFYYRILPLIVKLLSTFENTDILLYGILVLRNIATDNERCIYMLNEGVIDFLVQQLSSMSSKVYIVNNINTLRNIITHSPLCRDYILGTNILMIFITLINSFEEDKDICKQICLCYLELVKNNKGRETMINMNIQKTIDHYMATFGEDNDIRSLLTQLTTMLEQDNKEEGITRLNSVSNLDSKVNIKINVKMRARPCRRGISTTPLPRTGSIHSALSKDSFSSASSEHSELLNSSSINSTDSVSSIRKSSDSLLSTNLESLPSSNLGKNMTSETKEVDIGNKYADVSLLESTSASQSTLLSTPTPDKNAANNSDEESKDLHTSFRNDFDLSNVTPTNALSGRSRLSSGGVATASDDTNGSDILVWALSSLRDSTNEEEIIGLISMLKVFLRKDKSLSLPFVRHIRFIPRFVSDKLSKYDRNEKMHLIGIDVISAFAEDVSTSKHLEDGETIELMNKDINTFLNNIKIITPILNTLTVLSKKPSLQERLISAGINVSLKELLQGTSSSDVKIAINTILSNLGLETDEVKVLSQDDLEAELNENIIHVVLEQLQRGNRSTKMTILFVLSQLFYDRCEWAIDQFFNQNGILAVLDLMKLCYTEKDIIQRSVELLYSISQIDKVLKKLEFSNLFEGLITILNVYKENPDIICNALATIYELCKLDSILSRLTNNLTLLNSLLVYYVSKDKSANNETLKVYASICDYIIRIYVSVIKDRKTNRLRLKENIIDVVIETIRKYKDIYSIQAACSFLHILSTETQLADKLRLSEAISVLLSTALSATSIGEDPDQLIEIIDTAGSIAQMSNANMCHFANMQGFRVLDNTLENIENDKVINSCISVIRNLTLSKVISRDILNTRLLEQLVRCLNKAIPKRNEEIIENCCGAIRNLVATSEEIYNALVELDAPKSLSNVLNLFMKNGEIVYQCSWAIHEFSERDVNTTLFPENTILILRQLLSDYSNSIDIAVKIKLALSSLRAEDFNGVSSLLPSKMGLAIGRRSSLQTAGNSLAALYKDNINENDIISDLKTIITLCNKDSVRKDIVESGGVTALSSVYKRYPHNDSIVLNLCSIFTFISSDDDYCGALCENNIFVMLSQILSSFNNQDIILQSLRIINNMCTTEKNCKAIVENNLIGICIDKMYNYKNIETFVEVGVNILFQVALHYDVQYLSYFSLTDMLSDFVQTVQENISLLIRIDLLIYKINSNDNVYKEPNYTLVNRVIEQIKKQIFDSNEYNNIRQNILVLAEREEYRVKMIESGVLDLLNRGYQKFSTNPLVLNTYLEALTALTSGGVWMDKLNGSVIHSNIISIMKTVTDPSLYRKGVYCLVNFLSTHECRQLYFDNNFIPVLISTIGIVSKYTDIIENIILILCYIINDRSCPEDLLDQCTFTVFEMLYKHYTSEEICKSVLSLFKDSYNNEALQHCISKYAPKSLLDTFSVSITKNVDIQNTLDLLTNFACSEENVDLLIQHNVNEIFFSILCKYIKPAILHSILNAYIYLCHYESFLKRVQSDNDLIRRLNVIMNSLASDTDIVSLCQSLLDIISDNVPSPSPPEYVNDFDLGPLPSFAPPPPPTEEASQVSKNPARPSIVIPHTPQAVSSPVPSTSAATPVSKPIPRRLSIPSKPVGSTGASKGSVSSQLATTMAPSPDVTVAPSSPSKPSAISKTSATVGKGSGATQPKISFHIPGISKVGSGTNLAASASVPPSTSPVSQRGKMIIQGIAHNRKQ